MLKTNKNITLVGESIVEIATGSGKQNVTVETYNATINTSNPEGIQYTSYIARQDLYKQYRETCAEDRKAFETAMYAEQDAMIAKKREEVGYGRKQNN